VIALVKGISALFLVAALGCGGGGPNVGATFNGVVRGQPMTPADAVSSPAHLLFSGVDAQVAAIVLTDVPNVCPKLSANTQPRSAKALLIALADFNAFPPSLTAPAGPGTFTVYDPTSGGIPPAHLAVVSFAADDASCIPTVQPAAGTSGSVRITSASGGSFTGTYTVGFETGEQVNGEFHTANCPGLATFLSGTTHPCG